MKLSEWRLKMTETVEKTMQKLGRSADNVRNKFVSTQDRLNRMGESFRRNIRAAAAEIPFLGRAIDLIRNPIVLVTAALVGLGATTMKAVNSAGEYKNQFLELQNLNLDKSVEELQRLDRQILRLSMSEGLNATKTAQAYYDVQSALGVYGEEVDSIVEKVGRFSIATKADFNESINSATKAMLAFGLTSRELDGYLASNAKTVQVGVTTFNELAKVQVEYAGAAAAANQSVDTANKLFAAFSTTAKDSRIAANQTKTAFLGLTQKSTMEGLAKIGINMQDVHGNMRDVDAIIRELVPKFQNMNDQQFLELRNSIGGPEGLQQLFNQLKTSGDDVIRMLDSFDSSEFDLSKALENAKGDFEQLKTIVGNQFNAVMVKLGNEILPTVAHALAWVSDVMSWFADNGDRVKDVLVSVGYGVGALAIGLTALHAKTIAFGVAAQIATAIQWLWNVALSANPIGIVLVAIGALVGALVYLFRTNEKVRGTILGIWEVLKGFGDMVKNYIIERIKGVISGLGSMGKAIGHFFKGEWSEAAKAAKDGLKGLAGVDAKLAALEAGKNLGSKFKEGYDSGVDQIKAKNAKAESGVPSGAAPDGMPTGAGASTLGNDGATSATVTSGLGSISGGGQTKNITVNIQKLVENINVHSKEVKEGAMDISRIIEEQLIKAIRGYEVAMSNGS